MIEIGLAIGVASKSFAAVKAMVAAGRELEDTVGQLSAWFGAVSDLNEAERQIKNPPLFRKLTNAKSVEQEAIEIFAAKRKAMAQEKELREIILYAYGQEAWREMIALRKKIKADREKAVYNQIRKRKALVNNSMIGLAIAVLLAGTIFLMTFIVKVTSE
jgi:hypothetical protein